MNQYNYFMNHLSDFQGQLAKNQLPYPKYYNGQTWNTIIDKSPNNMPSYLSQDLPPLKYQYIRHKFKEMSQFACPRLTYFEKIINKKRQSNSINSHSPTYKKINKDLLNYQISTAKHIRQQMKYALLTGKQDSNVVNQLIDKANKIETKIHLKKCRNNKRQSSLKTIKEGQRCFENTLAIVLNLKKKRLSSHTNQDINNKQIQKRVQSIKLLPYLPDQDI